MEFNIVVLIFIALNLLQTAVGAGLCFAPIKWQKGLITAMSIKLGMLAGGILATIITIYLFDSEASGVPRSVAYKYIEYIPAFFVISVILGAIIMPVLTYTVSKINRFVLGYIVGSKLTIIFTVGAIHDGLDEIGNYLFNGNLNIEIIIVMLMPVIIGSIFGIILASLDKFKISAYVVACSYIGASECAPNIEKYLGYIKAFLTGDIGAAIDPIDMIFSSYNIELNSMTTFVIIIILMGISSYYKIKSLLNQGYSLDTNIALLETEEGELVTEVLDK